MGTFFKLYRHLNTSPNITTILADGYSDDALISKYDNHRVSRPASPQSVTSLGSRLRFSFDSLLSKPDCTAEYMLGQRRQSIKVEEFKRDRTLPSSWLGKAKYYYDLYNCRYFAPFFLLFLYSIFGAWIFYLVEYENEKDMKVKEVYDLDRLRTNAFQRIVALFQARRRSERIAKSKDLLVWYESELQRVKLPEALEWDMWGALFYVGTIFTTIGYGNIVPRTITGRALSVVYAIIGIPLVLAILSRFGQFLEQNIARVWLKHREKIKEAHKQTRKRLKSKTKAEVSLGELEEGRLAPLHVKSDSLEDKLIDESRTIPIWLALLICISWICACAGLFLIWEKRWTFFSSLYFFFISLSTIGLGDVVPDHPHMLILMFWLVIIGLSIVSMLLTVIQIKFEEWLYNFMIRMQEEYQRNLASGLPLNHEEIRKRAMEDQPFLMKLFAPDLISDSQMEKIEEKAEQFERITSVTNNKNIQTELPAASTAETQVERTANSMACDPMSMSDSSALDEDDIHWMRDGSVLINEDRLVGRSDDGENDSMSDATSLPMDSISISKWKPVEKHGKHVVFGDNDSCTNEKHVVFVDNDSFTNHDDDVIRNVVFDLSEPPKCVHVQTDISQFQIDEIVLRLAALQANRALLDDDDVHPALFCGGRRGKKRHRNESVGEKSIRDMSDKEILTTMLQMMTKSMETDPIPQKVTKELGVNTQTNPLISRGVNTQTLCRTQSIETVITDVVNRSVATDATILVNRSMETSSSRRGSEESMNMSWNEKVHRDMMTSPILQRLIFKTICTGQHSKSSEDLHVADNFQQTSQSMDRPPRSVADQSQQTSTSISLEDLRGVDNFQQTPQSMNRPPRSVADQSQQTSTSISLEDLQGVEKFQQTSQSMDRPPRSVADQSKQTSTSISLEDLKGVDNFQQTSQSMDRPPRSVADQSQQTYTSISLEDLQGVDKFQQTSQSMDRPPRSVADQSQQTSTSISLEDLQGVDKFQQTSQSMDRPPRSVADQSKQTSTSVSLEDLQGVDKFQQTSQSMDRPPRSVADQSKQTSTSVSLEDLQGVDKFQQTSQSMDRPPRSVADQSKQTSTSVSLEDLQGVDKFQQTSQSMDRPPRSVADQSQQTSTSILLEDLQGVDKFQQTSQSMDRPPRSVADQSQQTSTSILLEDLQGVDKFQQTSQSMDRPPRSVADQSQQTSTSILLEDLQGVDKFQQTSQSMDRPPRSVADQSQQTSTSILLEDLQGVDKFQQTSQSMDRPPRSVADQSKQTSTSVSLEDLQGVDIFQQTSQGMDRRSRSVVDQSQQTSISIDTSPRRRPERHCSTQISPNVVDQTTSPTLAELVDRSIQGSPSEMESKSQQTSFVEFVEPMEANHPHIVLFDVGPQNENELHHSDACCNSRASTSCYDVRMTDSMEMSTQYSPPMSRSAIAQNVNVNSHGIMNKRARSSSTSGLGNSIYDDDTRQEVIIQTDDSYLKIARRLDEYRSNRTQFLPVVAAAPLGSRDIEPFKVDRPSERCGFYLDVKRSPLRRSIKYRRGTSKTSNADSQTGASLEMEPIASNHSEKSRSISPESPPRPRKRLARVASLPAGVARGKVGEYIAKHERGIPNPAVGRDRPVRIVRQYAMVDKET